MQKRISDVFCIAVFMEYSNVWNNLVGGCSPDNKIDCMWRSVID